MKQSKGKSVVKLCSPGGLFLLCLGLSCLGVLGIFVLGKSLGSHFGTLHLTLILSLFFIEYVLISSTALCLAALFRGGFSKLKKVEEEGLLYWVLSGLIFGLIGGFVGWLTGWLVVGFFFGLVVGLAFGLIGGLIGEFV